MPDPVALYELAGYVFDRGTGRFQDANGREVPRARIMRLIQERIDFHAGQMTTLTQALVDGRLTLAQWEQAFALQLKDLYLQQAALARGGWQNMTQADFGRVGRELRDQYRYLHGFAQEIAAGYPRDRWLWRAGLYAAGGRSAYWNAMTATAMTAGMTRERRIARGDKATCSPCVDLARRGWQPIGTLPAPGGPPCAGLNACRCQKEYV